MTTTKDVFGAARATTIAALCAGAGFAIAGCGRTEETKPPATKDAAPKPDGGEHHCGGDTNCGAGEDGSKDK